MEEVLDLGFYSQDDPDPRGKPCLPRREFERCASILGVEPESHCVAFRGSPGDPRVDEVLEIVRELGFEVVHQLGPTDPARTITVQTELRFVDADLDEAELLVVVAQNHRFERAHSAWMERREVLATKVRSGVHLGRDDADNRTLVCSGMAKSEIENSALSGIRFEKIPTTEKKPKAENATWRLCPTKVLPPVLDGYWTSSWDEERAEHSDSAHLWSKSYPEVGACWPGGKWVVPVYRFARKEVRGIEGDLVRSREAFGWPMLRTPVMLCTQEFRAFCAERKWKLHLEPAILV